MSATFVAYIDESGDEGYSFARGSSDWFVLSAVVTRKASDLQTVKLIDEVRTLLGKPEKKPLHFRDLRHEHRIPFLDRIARADLRVMSAMVHKPSLASPENFQQQYRLYFYSVRYLLERISWYCRDHRTEHDAGDGGVEIIFSNRSGMSYEDMKNYLRLLRDQTGPFDVQIDWNVVDPDRITAYTSGKRMGLQIADAVASGFYSAVQTTQYGFTEDRYARILHPVVYHRKGRYQGYGLKFWPRELEEVLEAENRFAWLRERYGGA